MAFFFFNMAEDEGYHDDWYDDVGIVNLMSRTERANEDHGSASYSGSESEVERVEADDEDSMVAMCLRVHANMDEVFLDLPWQEFHAKDRKSIAWTRKYRDYFGPMEAPLISEWRLAERERQLDEENAEAYIEQVQMVQQWKEGDVEPKAEMKVTEPIKEEVQKVHERKEDYDQPKAEMNPGAMGKGKGCVKSKAGTTGPEHEDVQKGARAR